MVNGSVMAKESFTLLRLDVVNVSVLFQGWFPLWEQKASVVLLIKMSRKIKWTISSCISFLKARKPFTGAHIRLLYKSPWPGEDPRWQRSKWILYSPPPRTKLELQLKYRVINLNN